HWRNCWRAFTRTGGRLDWRRYPRLDERRPGGNCRGHRAHRRRHRPKHAAGATDRLIRAPMLRKEKAIVRDFYEEFGWTRDTSGTYNDTASFVDLRPVLSSYYHDTQMRVKRFLNRSGKYFPDAGSGPLSQPEYLLYSDDYAFRV